MTPKAIALILAAGLLAGCLGEHGRGAPTPPTAGGRDWLLLEGRASPEGTINVFDWTVPTGSDAESDWLNTKVLVADIRPVVASGQESDVREWGLVIFDRFRDGPDVGLWRPQYYSFVPEGFQQDDAGPRRPLRPIHESETIELYNKTGFDGVRLKIVVLARSDAEMRFGVAVDILEGLAEAPPDFTSQLPAALPDGLRPSQVLRPANTSRGFLLSGFYEAWSTRVSYVLQSRTMEVTRKAGAEAPSFAGGLRVSGAHPSAGGWTLVSALFHSVAGVASFKVDAEYRGRATRAEGLGADAMGLGGSPAGSAAVPIHFGYVSGDGPSRFTMDIDYADHPQAHRFQYLRIDVDDDMSALLGGRVFELWKDEKRIAG